MVEIAGERHGFGYLLAGEFDAQAFERLLDAGLVHPTGQRQPGIGALIILFNAMALGVIQPQNVLSLAITLSGRAFKPETGLDLILTDAAPGGIKPTQPILGAGIAGLGRLPIMFGGAGL